MMLVFDKNKGKFRNENTIAVEKMIAKMKKSKQDLNDVVSVQAKINGANKLAKQGYFQQAYTLLVNALNTCSK